MNNSTPSIEAFQDPQLIDHTPIRPLKELSDYTVHELPMDLEQVRGGRISTNAFRKKLDFLAAGVMDIVSGLTPSEAAVARVDAMLLQQAFQCAGALPSKNVHVLADTVAAHRPISLPSLSYEDLILSNPQEDPRLFNNGDLGRSELFFYEVHRSIEKIICSLLDKIRPLVQENEDSISAIHSINRHDFEKLFSEQLMSSLIGIEEHMLIMNNELPIEHFNTMRNSFMPNIHRGIPGPSGKFSAGFYVMDELFLGDTPEMAAFNLSKRREQPLFPVGTNGTTESLYADQQVMQHADFHVLQGFPTLRTIGMHLSDFSSHIQKIFKKMLDIRKAHFQLFAKFIGTGSGTGGAKDAAEYLKVPIRIYADAAKALD